MPRRTRPKKNKNKSTRFRKKPKPRPKKDNRKPIPDYLGVLDFECTCDEDDKNAEVRNKWVHEIIEFPVVFLNTATLEVDFIFHTFVRPIEIPILTEFCINLTGIKQENVDPAPILPDVIIEFQKFLDDHFLSPVWEPENGKATFALATDGRWDFESFLLPECLRKSIPYPEFSLMYVNVRWWYANTLGKGKQANIKKMLKACGLEFEGRAHSGLDDAKNIARIARHLYGISPKIHWKRVPGSSKALKPASNGPTHHSETLVKEVKSKPKEATSDPKEIPKQLKGNPFAELEESS